LTPYFPYCTVVHWHFESSASEGDMQGKAPSGGRRTRASAAAAELQYRVGRIVLIRNGKLVAPTPHPIKKPR
jgi:hypothetical protein